MELTTVKILTELNGAKSLQSESIAGRRAVQINTSKAQVNARVSVALYRYVNSKRTYP